jgi:hypothetical protein
MMVSFDKDSIDCIEHHLQRGEPLLAINHCSEREVSDFACLLLKNYCSEEVRLERFSTMDPLSYTLDICPERAPLPLKGPYIRSLKQRNDKALGAEEYLLRCLYVREHQ